MFLQVSLTYAKNSTGPKTLPSGTPEVTLTSLDSRHLNLALCVRPTTNSLAQTTTLESTPSAAIFVSSRSWGTMLGCKEMCNLAGRWFIGIGKCCRLEWARYVAEMDITQEWIMKCRRLGRASYPARMDFTKPETELRVFSRSLGFVATVKSRNV
jgi:hypothetical protein